MTTSPPTVTGNTTIRRGAALRLARSALLACCLSGGLMLCSSCIGNLGHPGSRTAAADPFLQSPASSPRGPASSDRQVPVRVADASAEGIQRTAQAPTAPVGVVRLAEWQPLAVGGPPPVARSVHVTPITARADLRPTAYQPPQPPTAPLTNHALDAVRFEDEYLFDGGDRALPVHFDHFNRYGLDTEDAVAEFSDHRGDRHVLPTNRVAIYSPRFGAVRTITTPGAGTSVALFALSVDADSSAGVRNRRTPLDRTQTDATGRLRMRSRASGVDVGTSRDSLNQSTRLVMSAKPTKAVAGLSFVGTGRFLQAERARLATSIQAAAKWSSAKFPMIIAKDDALQEVRALFKPQELVGLSEEHLRDGELRIVKLADRKVAKPGEVVTFTIRYDNLGDRSLHHIRIIDNLTPRLEYVEESATSDRPGRLDIEDNAEGSVVLKFVLDDPLEGGEGGLLTFEALVR